MDVLECESAEDAISILDQNGASVCFLFTDVKLAGAMTGTALAFEVGRRFPNIDIVVTSGALPVEQDVARGRGYETRRALNGEERVRIGTRGAARGPFYFLNQINRPIQP